MKKTLILSLTLLSAITLSAQVWKADLGDGNYQNPILYADYSDPDVCRVGNDFYMTSSSFNCVPGLQIMHSQDLIHWEMIGAALPTALPGTEGLETPQYGGCVWAPSIRYHNGTFYIYYGDPDRGIFMLRTNDIRGRWDKPVLVKAGKGMIDPCPLWDNDGRVYLVHAYAGSRAGLKSVLAVMELDSTGTQVLQDSRIIYDGHRDNPTIEGPKFYKRNGYYYIFAPAGGVKKGWQLALRSSSVYGPYETKVVLSQGETAINGPHQGAWVDTEAGENWFLHFQDAGIYGRIVHLQPMKWESDWPVIGKYGNPVTKYKKPALANTANIGYIAESDEFDSATLGWQWQWASNINPQWYFCDAKDGYLRLFSYYSPLAEAPNILLQKFPAPDFQVTTRMRFSPSPKHKGEQAGLILDGPKPAYMVMKNLADGIVLSFKAESYNMALVSVKPDSWVYLRMQCKDGGQCIFSYSTDGKKFKTINIPIQAVGRDWIGAKMGLFCTRAAEGKNDGGWLDVDYWHVEPLK